MQMYLQMHCLRLSMHICLHTMKVNRVQFFYTLVLFKTSSYILIYKFGVSKL